MNFHSTHNGTTTIVYTHMVTLVSPNPAQTADDASRDFLFSRRRGYPILPYLMLSAVSTTGGSAVTDIRSGHVMMSLVQDFIICRLDNCNALLYGIADCQLQRLQWVQNSTARLVTGLWRTEHITRPSSLHSLYRFGNGWRRSWQLWCTNALMVCSGVPVRVLSSKRRSMSRNEISRQWETPHTTHSDFI